MSADREAALPIEEDGAVFAVTSQRRSRYVYVSSLSKDVQEQDILNLARGNGRQVESLEWHPDKRFAIASFEKISDASDALQEMWGKELKGQKLRVNFGKKPRVSRHVFVGNLSSRVDEDMLRAEFATHGEIQMVRMFRDLHYSFIDFVAAESALSAVASLNGKLLGGQHIIVDFGRDDDRDGGAGQGPRAMAPPIRGRVPRLGPPPHPRVGREPPSPVIDSSSFLLRPGEVTRHLIISNVASTVTQSDLEKVLVKQGHLENVVLHHDLHVAFASFRTAEEGANAVDALDDRAFDRERLHVECLPTHPSLILFVADAPGVTRQEITSSCERGGKLDFVRPKRDGLLIAFQDINHAVKTLMAFRNEKINGARVKCVFVKDTPEIREEGYHGRYGDRPGLFPPPRDRDSFGSRFGGPAPPLPPPGAPAPPPDARISRHLWVGSISDKVTEEELGREFSRCGPVEMVKVFYGRGYGFVDFVHPEDAVRAKTELQGRQLGEMRITINFGKGERKRPAEDSAWSGGERHPPEGPPESYREERSRNGERFPRMQMPIPEYDRVRMEAEAGGAGRDRHFARDRPGPPPPWFGRPPDEWRRPSPPRGHYGPPPGVEPGRFREPGLPGPPQDRYGGDRQFSPRADGFAPAVGQSAPPLLPDGDHKEPGAPLGPKPQFGAGNAPPPPQQQPSQQGTPHTPIHAQARGGPAVTTPGPVTPQNTMPLGQGSGPALVMTLCKGSAPVCSVMSRVMSGPPLDLSTVPEQLSVQWRTDLALLSRHLPASQYTLVSMSPLREEDRKPYQDFMNYLLQRNRAGVAKLPSSSVYVIPPVESAVNLLGIGKRDELVGAFVSATAVEAYAQGGDNPPSVGPSTPNLYGGHAAPVPSLPGAFSRGGGGS